MKKKSDNLFKNFSYSFAANGTNTLVAMILVMFVPKLLGVTEYSYWQLYLFYGTYVGFFHFGWADGIYLKFGGKKYEELDKGYFHVQFWLLVIMEIVIAAGIAAFSMFFIEEEKRRLVLYAIALCCILQIPRTFLQYILQTTNRIANYAKNFLLEKIIYAVLVVIALAAGVRSFPILVAADLFARGFTLVLLVKECRNIVFIREGHWHIGIRESIDNISVGIKLMFANIASQLLLGIVRWGIERRWDIETFGKVSLSITASNLLMTFINAVSIVLYPMLKTLPKDKYSAMYSKLRDTLMIMVLGLLVVYYPAKLVLSCWLPQYAESLKYMALLFPMCVYESKMTMLVTTYLKALRKEKMIMFINWVVVALTALTTIILIFWLENLVLAIVSLPILMGIRSCIGEYIVAKEINIKIYKDILAEIGLAAVFILVSWFLDSWLSMFIYLITYLIYLSTKKEVLIMLLHKVKLISGKK